MVRRELAREGKLAHWVDGRLPTNESIILRTSIREMVKAGLDRVPLRNNPLYQRSYRRKLDRYENFMQLLDLYLENPPASTKKKIDYAAYLLDPFTEFSTGHCLVHELAELQMYHKNKRNFRALLLISNPDHAAEVEQSIEKLASTIRFLVSSPESFADYGHFQKRLDEFLFETTRYVDNPPALEGYLSNVGFRIERSIHKKS